MPATSPTPEIDVSYDLRLLSAPQIAELLDLKVTTVYEKMSSGEIPSVYLGSKTRRVRASDFRAYIAALPTSRPS